MMGQGTATTSPGLPPPRIVAGIGCRRGTEPGEIIALIHQCLAEAATPINRLVALATHTVKADDPAIATAAAALGVPLRLLADAELAPLVPTPSAVVRRHTGLPSIAEACALAAGSLLLPKRQTSRVTCALGLCAPDWQLASFGEGAAQSITAATASSTSATSRAGG